MIQRMFKGNIIYFYYVFAIYILVSSIIIIFVPYGNVVLFVNQYANHGLDKIAIFLTQFGLGIVMGVIGLVFLFINYYYSLATFISLIFTGIFTGIFKKILFKGMPRPTGYFNNAELHHLIDGFNYHELNTFPSGHAMTTIAITLLIAIAINSKGWSMFFAAFGVIVAFTRIYLLQHFLLDIFVGSIFGVLCALLGLYFAQLILKNKKYLLKRGLLKNKKRALNLL